MAGYGTDRYGGEAYGGTRIGLNSPQTSGISIPGTSAVFFWVTSGAAGAYGQAAWGGARSVTHPSAGIYAIPDGNAGTVTLPLWWAYSSSVNLVRIRTDDGSSTPVRIGSPFLTGGTSYHNACQNPKAALDTVGATPDANTTISRLTGLTTPSTHVTTAFRAKATAAGTVTLAFQGEPVTGLVPWTFGFWARTSATATAIQIAVTWYDQNGTSLGVTDYTVGGTARTEAVNAWSWCQVNVTSWPTNASVGSMSYQATGLATNGTFDVTGRISGQTSMFPVAYFDGDYPGGSWNGTVGESTSDLGPTFNAVDGEAPLDVPFYYEMTNPSVPGFVAQTQTVTLPSNGNTWLTHPGNPATVPVWIEAEPDITNTITQGVFKILGRANQVVISDPQRAGDTGTMIIVAQDFDTQNRLRAMFADGSPLLIRAPAGYGHPAEWWLSFGDLLSSPAYVTTTYGRIAAAPNELRRFTVPFTQVDRPSAATRPLVI